MVSQQLYCQDRAGAWGCSIKMCVTPLWRQIHKGVMILKSLQCTHRVIIQFLYIDKKIDYFDFFPCANLELTISLPEIPYDYD